MNARSLASLVALPLVLLAGCSRPPPKILSFTADQTRVAQGDAVTLSWSVTDADRLVLDPGGQVVTGSSLRVSPNSSTRYVLKATNTDNQVPVTASLLVDFVTPWVGAFTASPKVVTAGDAVTLQWVVRDLDTLSLDQGLGSLPATSGSAVVHPTADTTYTLTGRGPGSAQPAPATVTVRVLPVPTIGAFAPDKATVSAGELVTLSWSSSGATFSLAPSPGLLGPVTSARVRPLATTTYELTAYNLLGSGAKRTAQVAVTGPAPGARRLVYADPSDRSAPLALVRGAASTDALLVLELVTTQAVQAGALALNLPLDATKVALDAAAPGDASPGFSLGAAGLDAGAAAPFTARAALATAGPLRNALTLGVSQRPVSGAVPDKALAAGTVLCRIRLGVAAGAQPGAVFPRVADPLRPEPADADKPYRATLRGQAGSSGLLALGTLTLQ